MYTLEAVVFKAQGKAKGIMYDWNWLRKGLERSAVNVSGKLNIHELNPLKCKARMELEVNWHKLKVWKEIVEKAKNPLVLIDVDLCFLDDIADGFTDKDITLTKRHKRWCNAGVIFVRPGEYANKFMQRWCDMDDWLHHGETNSNGNPLRLVEAWKHTGVNGHNQTALAMIKDEFEFGWVPGWKYNASQREEWDREGQKVVHVKDSLRRDLLFKKKRYKVAEKIIPYYY